MSHEVAVKILTQSLASEELESLLSRWLTNRAAKLVLTVVRTQLLSMGALQGLLECLQDTGQILLDKVVCRENAR